MKLVINKDRSVIPIGTWGTKNENDYEILEFEFPEELENYNKRIVYYLDDTKPWDAIVDNKAYITNAITSKENVKAYIWCTKENSERPADTDFRSQEFEMHFYENENADGIVPTPVQVDGFNTILTAMNAKIDEVDALEQTIETAEAERQEAEATRVSNESTRESNESTRQTNEETRQTQEADRERRTDEAIADIEDKTAEYNANAEAKTTAFNNNATQKTNEFNSNYTQKVNNFNSNASSKESAFNSNASSKTSAFNSNAETKTNAFNTNATSKTNDFNSNATEKTTAFDNNASTKTSEFNTNVESKTSAFNDNATQKTINFDNNASEKTDEFNTNAQNKIDEYDEHIVEYQAQIDELQEEVEELSENMPWNTTEQATEISVDDAAKYSRNKLEIFGNTEQIQYTGKNLLPYPYTKSSETTNGIIFTDLGNGSIMINGTATKNAYFSFFGTSDVSQQQTIPGDYVYCENGNSNIGLRVMHTQQVGQSNQYITLGISRGMSAKIDLSTYTTGYVEVMVSAGATVNNLVVRPMITMNEDNDYEPYTGGQPSPSPDYPQPIHVVTGENTIEVQGKNLFDKNKVTIYGGYFSATGVIKGKGSSGSSPDKWFYVPCKPNTTYIIIKPVTPVLSNNRFRIGTTASIPNDNSILNDFWMDPNGSTVTQHIITTSNNAKYLCVYYGTNPDAWGDKILEVLNGLMISYFSSYPINLGSLELCKIGNYQDYLYKENGNWYKHKAINKGNFNALYNDILKVTSYIKPGLVAYACNVLPTKKIGRNNFEVFCDNFSQKYLGSTTDTTDTNSVRNSEGIASHTRNVDQLVISIDETRLSGTSAEDFYNYITNLNPQIAYILNTPTITQITDETLISQLDAIYEHLQLVKGTNNITVTAEDLAPNMQLSYMQDLPSKLDNLDSRLALLE